MKIKEILATTANKMAHKSHDNALEDYKAKVMVRIDEAIKDGRFDCLISQLSCPTGCWKEIMDWLRDLEYVVDWKCGSPFANVKWDDLSVIKIGMMTEPKPAVSRIEFGWKYDPAQCDFVCSGCGKHSEYTTDYCPNCGVKTYVPVGEKQRKY